MVSILLDIIKFLLIYRYLQNAYWFKRGCSNILAKKTQKPMADGKKKSTETCNALHPPPQHAASALAACCTRHRSALHSGHHPCAAFTPLALHSETSTLQSRKQKQAANRPRDSSAPKTTVRSLKKHGIPSLPESLLTPDIRPQETEKSTLYRPKTLKPVKRSWEKLKKKPYLCSP